MGTGSGAPHDELFAGADSLQSTDPELLEVFDAFVRGDVQQHGTLEPRTRRMALLASMIATGALSTFRVTLVGALEAGITPIEVKEVVYQAVPYVGMAKVADVLQVTNEVLLERGVALPLPGRSTTTRETRFDRGLQVQKQIVGGDVVDGMYAAAPADEAHLQRFLSANCFGDHVARAGLDIPTRELLTFAMLVSLGGCEPQAKGHAVANVRAGNDRGVLLAVITQLLPYIGYPRTLNALRIIDEVAPAQQPPAGSRPGPAHDEENT